MKYFLLDLVPMWFRTRWPLKRYYFQAEDLEAARILAEQYHKEINWE